MYSRTVRVLSFCACMAAFAANAEPAKPIPDIQLNQVGFAVDGPKRAILKSDADKPLEWKLVDADGKVFAQGTSVVFGENPQSGERVHQIDFSAYDREGSHLRLSIAGQQSNAFVISKHPYPELKYDALAYFYHNRSGAPIEAAYMKDPKWARPAGHMPEKVTCFNQKDTRGNQWPGCDYTLDATGGWYDAGDHGKYVVNAGISVWTLLNYYEHSQRHDAAANAFADGKVSIPERGNGVNDLLDEVRWEMNFLLGMQAPEGAHMKLPRPGQAWTSSTLEFIDVDVSGMAHHKLHGEQWTNMPSAPGEDHKPRYAYPPSVTATLNLAANAAQCARVWKTIDPAFSKRCLESATRAYKAALRNPELLPFGAFSGGGGYGDRDASDEFYWAAAELFITTGDDQYLQALKSSPHFLLGPAANGEGEISWGQTRSLGTISLAMVPNRLPQTDVARARESLIAAADRYAQQAQSQGYAIPYDSMKYPWGSNSTILNHALVLGTAYDFTQKAIYKDRMVDAIDYLLGRNPLDQSFITGYGTRPLLHPHHRFWSNQLDPKYPSPPPGALSGGPNNVALADPISLAMQGKCLPQTCFADDTRAFAVNEVAINWNAPLVWVAGFLDE